MASTPDTLRNTSFNARHWHVLDKIIWSLRITAMRRHLPEKAGTVVDLGCGYQAPLLQNLLSQGLATHAIGVDVASDQGLAVQGLSFISGDLNHVLPIGEASADVVLSLAVIEHLFEPLTHVQEAFRILKPGGTFLMTTPTPRAKPLLEFLAFRLGVIDKFEIADHKHYFDAPELRTLLESVGFSGTDISTETFQFGFNNLIVARKR